MPGLVIAWIIFWALTGLLQVSANQQLTAVGNATALTEITTRLASWLRTDSSASTMSMIAAALMIGYIAKVLSFTRRPPTFGPPIS